MCDPCPGFLFASQAKTVLFQDGLDRKLATCPLGTKACCYIYRKEKKINQNLKPQGGTCQIFNSQKVGQVGKGWEVFVPTQPISLCFTSQNRYTVLNQKSDFAIFLSHCFHGRHFASKRFWFYEFLFVEI